MTIQVITPVLKTGIPPQIKIPAVIRIPGGEFIMGSNRKDFYNAQPARKVTVSEFTLGQYPVTNEEFKEFLTLTGKTVPTLVADSLLARHPVVNVSFLQANEYCRWLTDQVEGWEFKLPAEAQWELAARGPADRLFSWGTEWDPKKAVFHASGTEPVDACPENVTPEGIRHLSGLVWEWTLDAYGRYEGLSHEDPLNAGKADSLRVLRGGAFDTWAGEENQLRTFYRNAGLPSAQNLNIGFRVAAKLVE